MAGRTSNPRRVEVVQQVVGHSDAVAETVVTVMGCGVETMAGATIGAGAATA